jgi:hypothetical protein
MSNALQLVAAAAGVPQRADPLRLPAATVVTGHFETKLNAFWSAVVGLVFLRKLTGGTRLMCWHQGGRGQGGMNQRTSATENDVMPASSHLTVSRRSGSRRRGGFDPLR